MKRIIIMALAVLMLFAAFSGCADKKPQDDSTDGEGQPEQNDGQANTGNEPSKLVSIAYPEKIALNDHEAQYEVRKQNAVDGSIISSINEFSAKSTSAIFSGEDGNVCYSPLSLYMALAMLSNGAKGETQDEILALLNETDTEYLSEQMGKLYRLMYRDNEASTFLIANSLWINSKYDVKQEYVDHTMDYFYAAVNEINFDGNTGDAISSWISDNTKGLLEPEIEIDTLLDVMYIVNTIYLKDEWQDGFNEDATSEGVFTLADGTEINADYMHGTFDTDVIKNDNFTAVSLPLKGTGKMTFVLPDEGVDAASLLSTPEAIEQIFNADHLNNLTVKLSLPKFSFESEFDLIQSLKDLGMNKAFDETAADLTGIVDNIRANAYVYKVQQGTDITVNESGLEAAAYTYIDVQERDMDPEILEFDFNRPFIFIVSLNEGVPVFIGVVQNPNK